MNKVFFSNDSIFCNASGADNGQDVLKQLPDRGLWSGFTVESAS